MENIPLEINYYYDELLNYCYINGYTTCHIIKYTILLKNAYPYVNL